MADQSGSKPSGSSATPIPSNQQSKPNQTAHPNMSKSTPTILTGSTRTNISGTAGTHNSRVVGTANVKKITGSVMKETPTSDSIKLDSTGGKLLEASMSAPRTYRVNGLYMITFDKRAVYLMKHNGETKRLERQAMVSAQNYHRLKEIDDDRKAAGNEGMPEFVWNAVNTIVERPVPVGRVPTAVNETVAGAPDLPVSPSTTAVSQSAPTSQKDKITYVTLDSSDEETVSSPAPKRTKKSDVKPAIDLAASSSATSGQTERDRGLERKEKLPNQREHVKIERNEESSFTDTEGFTLQAHGGVSENSHKRRSTTTGRRDSAATQRTPPPVCVVCGEPNVGRHMDRHKRDGYQCMKGCIDRYYTTVATLKAHITNKHKQRRQVDGGDKTPVGTKSAKRRSAKKKIADSPTVEHPESDVESDKGDEQIREVTEEIANTSAVQAPGPSTTVTENVEGGVDGIDDSLDALRHMTANAASETDGLKFVGLYKKLLKQQRDAKK